MVTARHETMHRIFQEDPGVFARAFHALKIPIPDPVGATVMSPDVTELAPVERRIDTLLRFDTADGGAFMVAVEAQSKKDPDKPHAWAYYAAYLLAKYRLPPIVLVVCHDEATARWAQGPFDIGLGGNAYRWQTLTVRPIVLGPHNVPVVDSVEAAARDIPLATLSAVTHAHDAGIGAILNVLAEALKNTDEDTARIFAELTELGLGNAPAAQTWRELMAIDTSFFRSRTSEMLRDEGRAEGLAAGRLEGEVEALADALLVSLASRGIEITDRVRERISDCKTQSILIGWIARAATAEDLGDVFAAH